MAKTIKITEDGFVWRVLTPDQAKNIELLGVFPLYALNGDDSESLINDKQELYELLDNNVQIGIEVGFTNYKDLEKLEQLIKQHDFYYQRSDDHRAYTAGLNNLNAIVEAKSCVSQEDYVSLWNKYAPSNLKFK